MLKFTVSLFRFRNKSELATAHLRVNAKLRSIPQTNRGEGRDNAVLRRTPLPAFPAFSIPTEERWPSG
jgi:hypothetical protein